MQQNGSPKRVFDTDDDYTYFLAVLPVHHEFLVVGEEATEKELQVLQYCLQPKKRVEVLKKIGLTNHPDNYRNYILPLIDKGWLVYTRPGKPTGSLQQYVTTEKGKAILS